MVGVGLLMVLTGDVAKGSPAAAIAVSVRERQRFSIVGIPEFRVRRAPTAIGRRIRPVIRRRSFLRRARGRDGGLNELGHVRGKRR